jgi:hypothetical protein
MVYGDGSCAVCGATVRVGYLMCSAHWHKVPKPLQDGVYEALRLWDCSEATLHDLRAAQAACVESVTGVTQEPTLKGSEEAETDKYMAEFYDRLERG